MLHETIPIILLLAVKGPPASPSQFPALAWENVQIVFEGNPVTAVNRFLQSALGIVETVRARS